MEKKVLKNYEVFPWNESFETGIKKIDEQHKNMVDLLNKTAICFKEDKINEIENIFDELISYAKYHFKTEEDILDEYIKFDEILSEHKDGHASFIPKIREIKKKYIKNKSNDVLEEILLFLIKWLAYHIIDEDKRLIFIIDSLQKEDIANNQTKEHIEELIKANSQKYDKQSIKAIHFIWECTLRMKTVKKLKGINSRLKDLITKEETG